MLRFCKTFLNGFMIKPNEFNLKIFGKKKTERKNEKPRTDFGLWNL